MTATNVANEEDGTIHVMSERCSTCIFRPGNLMGLREGRRDSMVAEALAIDGCIPCHQTIHGEREQEAVCRGFFDRHAEDVFPLRLAKRFNAITYDEDD